MSLVEFVIENVPPQKYYQAKFPQWNGDFNSNVSCPWAQEHESGKDHRPSFSINIKGTGGCFCHSCGKKIASIIHFEKLFEIEKDDETAASNIYSELIRPVIACPKATNGKLKGTLVALKGAPKIFGILQNDLEISKETIVNFKLGYDPKDRRITIPIFDRFNQLVNFRLYRLPSMREGKDFPKLLNTEGYGSPAELFPAPLILSLCSSPRNHPEILYWMTGESDVLKAWDDGIPSFCFTTGENVAKEEWVQQIKDFGCTIGVLADNDKAGDVGAKKRIALLEKFGIPCFRIDLEGDKIKDYRDYRREGGTAKDFIEYGKENQPSKNTPKDSPLRHEGKDHYEIPRVANPSQAKFKGEHTVDAIGHNPDLLNHPIQVRAIISGRVEQTYSIPYVFRLGNETYEVPISRELLQFIKQTDVEIIKMAREWLNTKGKVEIHARRTVQEVEIIPMVQPGIDSAYVNQACFFFGPRVDCNKPYMMQVIPTTLMNSQKTVGLITDVSPVSNILDCYKFDAQSYARLSNEFHPVPGFSLLENAQGLANSIAENYSGISQRNDLHLSALLTWLSPLQFQFPYESGLQRGWLNTLVLGDTETGKSQVCRHLTSLFHCGVFINAESCSYVGLVGGAVKSSSGMFLLRWGKIPLYNRQLVVIEELSGMSTEEISWMSDIRSAGVARYDKAGLTGETAARTRLLALSNVRGAGKALADFPTGVQAAQALVGHNEDLARFDIILTAIDDEVESSVINRDRSTEEKKSFTEDELGAFKELAMFAWSLRPEQIEFTLSSYKMCLQATMDMCKIYHPSLPVFKAGSGRLKLARLGLAFACLQFSWDEAKQKLIVTDQHISAAAEFLTRLYAKPSFGYKRYSHIQNSLGLVGNVDAVISMVKATFKDKQDDFYLYVSTALSFNKIEIAEALGQHPMFVERVISCMFLANLLKKGERNDWRLSHAGRKWVEGRLHVKQ